MRTIKIERERWRTPTSGTGCMKVLINSDGCGCIMGLVGVASGIDPLELIDRGALRWTELEPIGLDYVLQEKAIEINDDSSLRDCDREAKLKELFKHVFTLEFV